MICDKNCECDFCEMLSTESVKIIDEEYFNYESFHFEHQYKCLRTGNVAPTKHELKYGVENNESN